MPNVLFVSGRRAALALALLALPAGVAQAQGTREQQEACAPDAVRLCASTIPDVAKTTACMKSHVADLGPRCRSLFNAATGGGGATVAAAKPTVVAAKPAPRHIAAQPPRDARVAAVNARRDTRAVARTAAVLRDDRRAVRTAALPARRTQVVVAPAPAPTPVVAEPAVPVYRSRVPGLDGVAASIGQSCRDGLIDAFTCRNTFNALQITE